MDFTASAWGDRFLCKQLSCSVNISSPSSRLVTYSLSLSLSYRLPMKVDAQFGDASKWPLPCPRQTLSPLPLLQRVFWRRAGGAKRNWASAWSCADIHSSLPSQPASADSSSLTSREYSLRLGSRRNPFEFSSVVLSTLMDLIVNYFEQRRNVWREKNRDIYCSSIHV